MQLSGVDYCASADILYVPGLEESKKRLRNRSDAPKDFVKCLSISPRTIQYSYMDAGSHFERDLMSHFEIDNESHSPHSKLRAVSLPIDDHGRIDAWYNPKDFESEKNHFSEGFNIPGDVRGRIVIVRVGKGKKNESLSTDDIRKVKSMIKRNIEHSTEELRKLALSNKPLGEMDENEKSSLMLCQWLSFE